jgi:hypothetical protein
MTESLKSLLDQQAASVAFKPPDLSAIARDSNRRIWRRRAVTALAGVAAAAVVVSAAVVVFALDGRRPDVADPVASGGVSWAVGSTIHDGASTIEVGHEVGAYVRTSVGYVTLDDAGDVYSVTGASVTRIGQAVAVPADGTEYTRLYSDPHGTLAGWVGQGPSGLVMQVHDQATGRTRTFETAPAGAAFLAIDDRTAYWRIGTRNGVFAVDFDTGDERQVATADVEIWSVENGVLAFSRDRKPRGNLTSVSVGRSIDDARQFVFGTNAEADEKVRLSPTGAWLSYLLFEFDGPPEQDKVRAFTGQVRDARTGEVIGLKIPHAGLAAPVVWLDDTTVQVLAIGTVPGRDTPQGNLLACTVPDGSCSVAADLPAYVLEGSTLVLPNGSWVAG